MFNSRHPFSNLEVEPRPYFNIKTYSLEIHFETGNSSSVFVPVLVVVYHIMLKVTFLRQDGDTTNKWTNVSLEFLDF